jgi:hypothetical protein
LRISGLNRPAEPIYPQLDENWSTLATVFHFWGSGEPFLPEFWQTAGFQRCDVRHSDVFRARQRNRTQEATSPTIASLRQLQGANTVGPKY